MGQFAPGENVPAIGLCIAPASRDTARAMAEQGVEVMRKWIDAWNRGDLDAFELDITSVNTISKGRIVRQEYYFDHAEAFEAVRLSE
jgi:hypothetical protein